MKHLCHLPECKRAVPRAKLFCDVHWKLLPLGIKDWVMNEYNAVEHNADGSMKRVPRSYLSATDAAIREVRDKLALRRVRRDAKKGRSR